MADVLRIEKDKANRTLYIYRCEDCGTEIHRLKKRDNETKVCYGCNVVRNKMKAIARVERREAEVRNKAIEEYHKAVENNLLNASFDTIVNDEIRNMLKGSK